MYSPEEKEMCFAGLQKMYNYYQECIKSTRDPKLIDYYSERIVLVVNTMKTSGVSAELIAIYYKG